MKKLFAIILCLALVTAFVPVMTASAAEKVVYIKDEANGDGSSPDKPCGTFEDAYAALGTEGGTIVVIDEIAWFEEFIAPEHTGLVTVTGKYNGTDYKGAIFVLDTKLHYVCGGDTKFENLTIETTKDWLIRGMWHHLTMGEGIEVINDSPSTGLFLVGGDNEDPAVQPSNFNTHITIYSGTYQEVIGGPRNGNATDWSSGNTFIEVTGADTICKKIVVTSRSAREPLPGGVLVLDGGIVTNWVCATAVANADTQPGEIKIVVTKNFKWKDSFGATGVRTESNGVFDGFSGSSCWTTTYKDQLVKPSSLLLDPAIAAEIMATDLILEDSFTTVQEYTYNGVFGSGSLEAPGTIPAVTTAAPETTAAPVTAAPSTTAAPEITAAPVTTQAGAQTDSPTTGSSDMVVFAVSVAALLAVVAIVIVRRRENA